MFQAYIVESPSSTPVFKKPCFRHRKISKAFGVACRGQVRNHCRPPCQKGGASQKLLVWAQSGARGSARTSLCGGASAFETGAAPKRRPRGPQVPPPAVRPSPPHSLPARPPITVFTTIRSTRRGVVFPSLKLLSNGDFEERAQRKHTLFPLLSLRGPHRSPGQAAGQVPG